MRRLAPARSLPGLTAHTAAGREWLERNVHSPETRGNVLPSQECGRAAGRWEGIASLRSLVLELISS